jgi:hypothetical protein
MGSPVSAKKTKLKLDFLFGRCLPDCGHMVLANSPEGAYAVNVSAVGAFQRAR